MRLFRTLILLLLVSSFVQAAAAAQPATPLVADDANSALLERLLGEALAGDPSLPGIAVRIESPELGVIEAAVGVANRDTQTPLTPDDSFRVASITKTFTAAAIYRLVEEGDLATSDPIADVLSPDLVDALEAGRYDPARITINHLLTHTSGIYNYATDSGFQAAALLLRAKQWSRFEIVQWAMEHGSPLSAPGAAYNYSDTGYVLLGDIIERATGLDLGSAYRELLHFNAIGLDQTYVPLFDDVPANEPAEAHQYAEDVDVTSVNPTTQIYGNAGIISTLADLSTFYRVLFQGKIFDRNETLSAMLTIPPVNENEGAASGIFKEDTTPTGWGHAGLWGAGVVYIPTGDLTIALAYNQAFPETLDGYALIDTLLATFAN
jgi:D-alanyl-D-alanine carboxypeptidase